jgi:hypothetical protein
MEYVALVFAFLLGTPILPIARNELEAALARRDANRYEPLFPSDPDFHVDRRDREVRFQFARVEFALVQEMREVSSVQAIAAAQERAWGILRVVPRDA